MTSLEQTTATKRKGGWPAGRPESDTHRENIRLAKLKRVMANAEIQARRAQVTTLIESGLTNMAVGLILGIGKSAVSGIIERMNRQGIFINRPPKPFKYRPKVPQPPQPRQHIIHPPMTPVMLWERTGCAYPTNDGGPFLFCNNERHEKSSYCEFHGNLMVNRI